MLNLSIDITPPDALSCCQDWHYVIMKWETTFNPDGGAWCNTGYADHFPTFEETTTAAYEAYLKLKAKHEKGANQT